MKVFQFSILCIPLFFSCGGSDEVEEKTSDPITSERIEVVEEVEEEVVNKITIETGIVGVFNVNQTVPEVLPDELKMRQFLETDVDDEGNSVEHTHNVVFTYLEDVVELIMEKGDEHHVDKRIEEMWVLTNYYETAKGITVGSTVTEFNQEYEAASLWYDGVHDRFYLECDELVGVHFILKNDDAKKKCSTSKEFKEVDFSYFDDEAKIAKIRVF